LAGGCCARSARVVTQTAIAASTRESALTEGSRETAGG
jgi:hypothetical protein